LFTFSAEEVQRVREYFKIKIAKGGTPVTKEEAEACMVAVGVQGIHWRTIKTSVWTVLQWRQKVLAKKKNHRKNKSMAMYYVYYALAQIFFFLLLRAVN
jgi:hypothetical protein